jgi:hypothetical protein
MLSAIWRFIWLNGGYECFVNVAICTSNIQPVQTVWVKEFIVASIQAGRMRDAPCCAHSALLNSASVLGALHGHIAVVLTMITKEAKEGL